jgi:hypothetical protein
MGTERTVSLVRRRVEYYTEQVNLLDFLKTNVCEVYASSENECVEIRMPTRVDSYSHFVAEIPFSTIDSILDIHSMIRNERHNDIFEQYIDHIIWKKEFRNVVTG